MLDDFCPGGAAFNAFRLRREQFSSSFEDEFVEKGVFAVVGGPDGHVEVPGDAGLGGLPEETGIGVLGEFVEANIAAVDGHGVWIG